MSDNPQNGRNRTDSNRTGSEDIRSETIIDAEVEPLGGGRSRIILRVIAYLAIAVAVSIGIAALYHLWSTGRLEFGSQPSAPPMAASPSPSSSPSSSPAPAVSAPVAAADPALQDRIADLDRRMAALSGSIERLQQLPSSSSDDRQALADMQAQIRTAVDEARAAAEQARGGNLAISEKLAALAAASEAQTAQRSALQQQVSELQTDLAALRVERAAAIREPVLLALAWSELRDRARRGSDFSGEARQLGSWVDSGGGEIVQAFAPLKAAAEKPVPSLSQLLLRFAAAAEAQRDHQAAAPAAAAGEPAAPWWQRAVDRVAGLVSIRRADTSGDAATPEGRMVAAETAIAGGDLAAAVAALDGLDAAPVLAAWRDEARTRLELDAALDRFGRLLRSRLAAQ